MNSPYLWVKPLVRGLSTPWCFGPGSFFEGGKVSEGARDGAGFGVGNARHPLKAPGPKKLGSFFRLSETSLPWPAGLPAIHFPVRFPAGAWPHVGRHAGGGQLAARHPAIPPPPAVPPEPPRRARHARVLHLPLPHSRGGDCRRLRPGCTSLGADFFFHPVSFGEKHPLSGRKRRANMSNRWCRFSRTKYKQPVYIGGVSFFFLTGAVNAFK